MKQFAIIIFSLVFFANSASANLSDSWVGEPSSGTKKYKAIKGEKFMISTASSAASNAGAWALKQGGSAVDAAIAAQLVLNVVEPHSSGIGGGGFLLYYDAKNQNTIYFNGRETAPARAHPRMFLDKNGKPKKFSDAVQGGLSVGAPGLLKILKESHEKYGELPWKKLFEPAISIAQNGFEVDERINLLAQKVPYLSKFDESREIYLDENGKPKKIGTIIKNPKMAQTLTTLANEGIDSFYRGQIAQDIVDKVRNSKVNVGYLSLPDMKNYRSKKGDLICAKYRQKYEVCSMPLPSSGGISILQILGILENFDLSKMQAGSKEFVHLFSEAARLTYADRNEYIADVSEVPIKQMLDKNYLQKRAALISFDKAMKKVEAGKFEDVLSLNERGFINDNSRELPSTTHLSIIDEDGNAVALTSSIEYFFGSGISVDGFMLNNQLTDFSFVPEINGKLVANRVQGGKQPRSSMSPAFVFDENGKLLMAVGSPGGPRIIQFVAKTIIYNLDFGLDIQKAISAPNFVALNDYVELEEGTKIVDLKDDLENMGHHTKIIDIVSGINAIKIQDEKTFGFFGDDKRVIYGGSDPRRHGAAVGE